MCVCGGGGRKDKRRHVLQEGKYNVTYAVLEANTTLRDHDRHQNTYYMLRLQ